MSNLKNIVFRKQIIDKIFCNLLKTEDNQSKGFLNITGNPGIGKSTLIPQIINTVKWSGVDLMPKIINCDKGITIQNKLQNLSNTTGFKLPDNKSIKPNTKIMHFLNTLVINPFSGILLIIDDAHHLSNTEYKLLKNVFQSLYSNHFCILVGRKIKNRKTDLIIKPFSDNEFNLFCSLNFGENWSKYYSDISKWLKDYSGNHPFILSLLIELLNQKGLLTPNYTAPIHKFNTIKPCNDLTQFIKITLSVYNKNSREHVILLASALLQSKYKDLNSTILKTSKKFRESNWFKKSNTFELKHPILKEIIFNNTSIKFKTKVIQKLLKINNLTIEDKFRLFDNLPSINSKKKEILIDLGNQFFNISNFDMALKCYSKINYQQINTAICYYKLFKYPQAIKILTQLKKLKTPLPQTYFILASIYFYQGNIKSSLKAISFLDNNNKYDDSFWKTKLLKMNCLHELQINNEINKELISIDKIQPISKFGRLMRMRIKSMINIRTPLGIDAEKHNKKGLALSRKLKIPDAEVYFNSCLMVHYIHKKNIEEVENKAQKLIQYSRDYSDFAHAYNAWKCLGIAYSRSNEKYKSINAYQNAVEIASNAGFTNAIDGLNLTLGMAWDNIGRKDKAIFYYNKTFQIKSPSIISQIQKDRIHAEVLFDSGKKIKAKQLLIKSIKNAEKYNLHIDISAGNLYLTNIVKNHSELDANEELYFKSRIDYIKLGRKESLISFDFIRILELSKYKQHDKIKRILDSWTAEKNKYYEIAEIIYLATAGIINGCLSKLKKLENEFDGGYLFLYLSLYKSLKQNTNFSPTQFNRFNSFYKLIKNISQNKKTRISKKEFNNYNNYKIFNIFYSWTECINLKKNLLSCDLDDLFANDKLKNNFIEILKLWKINIISNDENTRNKKPILIQILGKPQLWLNGNKLDKKYWKVRKSLEVLIYLIISGRKFKSEISVNNFYKDILEISPEDWDKRIDRKNVILYRLKNIYKEIEDKLILNGGEYLTFNWNSNAYKIDILSFDKYYFQGMNEFQSQNFNKCKLNLEYIINLYRGDLSEGFGGLWIEPARGEYFQKYKEAIESLLFIYKKEKNKNDALILIEKVKSIYPDYEDWISIKYNIK